MKTLHSIGPKYNLTREELSVLVYCQLGLESGWHFKMIKGVLNCRRYEEKPWFPVKSGWYFPATMNVWKENQNIIPDLSVIEK